MKTGTCRNLRFTHSVKSLPVMRQCWGERLQTALGGRGDRVSWTWILEACSLGARPHLPFRIWPWCTLGSRCILGLWFEHRKWGLATVPTPVSYQRKKIKEVSKPYHRFFNPVKKDGEKSNSFGEAFTRLSSNWESAWQYQIDVGTTWSHE